MSKTPFMPLWVGDFLADTQGLSAQEVGAYMLLLMSLWQRGGTLPDDSEKLRRTARVERGWPKVWASISGYFKADNGLIWSERLLSELTEVRRKSTIRTEVGALGGRAKALKSKGAPVAKANVLLSHLELEPELEERVGSNEPTARKRAACAREHLDPILGPELAAAFVAHRTALKAPLTPHAGKLMASKLAAMPDPVAAVTLSLERGWKGVFEPEPASVHPFPSKPKRQSDGERLDDLLGGLAARVAVQRLE